MTETRKPLKILQLTSGTHVNGALVHCKLLSSHLARRGHQVTIGCRKNSWLWKELAEQPVRVVTCQMKRWPLDNLTRFADWIRRERFDVIHTHMSSAHMFGIIMNRMTGVPVAATAHCRHVQPWWRLNNVVIANSESTYRFHRRVNWVPNRQITKVHPFIDNEKFQPPDLHMYRAMRREWRFALDTQVIVIAGDVVSHKGHYYLFETLPQLLAKFPKLRVVVVGRFRRGEAYTNRLRRFLVDHQLYNKVKWLGRRDNMQDVLGAADVVAIPSLVESFGMVALESMAVGTPVVASDTGGLRELIKHQQNGLLIAPKDSQRMATAIEDLLSHPELRDRLTTGGRQMIEQCFSPDRLIDQIETVLYEATCVEKNRIAA